MAFTKIVSPGIDTTGSYTVQELNTVGVVTAATVQVGSATTIHTTGIDLGSGNITSHNINSTGIITATSFVGPVTGNITGDITATSGTFSGNVSIAGTLTYEDVTNIDSVGIITARSGLDVSGDITLTDTDTGSAAGPELKLFRNSASPANADYLGQIKFAGESDTGVERNYAKITGKISDASNGTEDGIIEFAFIKAGSQNINARFKSTELQLLNDTDFSVAGDSTFTGDVSITDKIVHTGDTNTAIRFPADDTVTVETAGSEKLRITSDGKVMMGQSSSSVNRNFSITGATGNSNDAEIGLQPTNSSGGINPEAIIGATADGSYGAHMFFTTRNTGGNRIERLRITSGGLVGIGTDDPDNFNPNADDLVISGTGHQGLTIRSGNAHDGSIMFNDTTDANQRGIIRYDHTEDALKFHTSGGEAVTITSGGEIKQYGFTGTSDTSADDLVLGNTTGGVNRGITIWSNSSQNGSIAFADNDSNFRGAVQYLHNGDSLRFLTAGDERLRINSSGLMVFPDVTADKIQLNGTAANYYRISKLAGGGNLSDGNFKFTAGNNAAGGFTFHSGGSEKFRIDSGGDLYQRTQRVHTVLHTEYRHLTGNVSTDSGSYVDIINFGYTPKRSGSLVVCHFQVQTWNGSASNMAGDIYFRARYDQGGGSYTSVQYGGLNERMTGNFDQDNNRQHLYYTHTFGFITQNTNQHTINLQTYNSATLSTDFNWFHTSNNGNGCWIFEYDQ